MRPHSSAIGPSCVQNPDCLTLPKIVKMYRQPFGFFASKSETMQKPCLNLEVADSLRSVLVCRHEGRQPKPRFGVP